jgi:hypothetical protein
MPTYRIYKLNPHGLISRPAQIVECDEDQEAIQHAQRAVNGQDVELWEGNRLVLRFPHDAVRGID